MMTSVTQAPPQFTSLCKALYGDMVDADVVWTVAKLAPGPSDVSTKGGSSTRRNIERASNAVGITAGSLGLAAALKDPRLASGGKIARALHATGKKMPEFAERIATKHPRLGGALAAGAVGTQVGNLGGDALIAGTLGEKPKKERRRKSDYALAKGERVIVGKAGVQGALFAMPAALPKGVQQAAHGLTQTWNKATAPITRATSQVPAAKMPGHKMLPGHAGLPTQSAQMNLPGLGPASVKATNPKPNAWRNAGSNAMGAVSSGEGKAGLAIGATGTAAAGSANSSRKRRSAAADPYGGMYKRDTDEIVFEGEFSKFDDDKRQAFGWASVVTKDGSPVLDKQGDYISIQDLEDAAYTYVHKSRVGGDMHKRNGDSPHKVSDMIESMVFTPEKIAKMGLPEGFPEGWWVGYQIHDEDTWQEVRKNGRTGFSIHGRGIRKDMDLDDLMGYTR